MIDSPISGSTTNAGALSNPIMSDCKTSGGIVEHAVLGYAAAYRIDSDRALRQSIGKRS
jgi:hypothetical protein